jgi:hypothetical protein
MRKVVVFISVIFILSTVAIAQQLPTVVKPKVKIEKISIEIKDPGIEQDFQLASSKNKKVVIDLKYRFQKFFGSFLMLQSKNRFKIKGTRCSADPVTDAKLGAIYNCQVKLLDSNYMEVRQLMIKTSTNHQKFYFSTF